MSPTIRSLTGLGAAATLFITAPAQARNVTADVAQIAELLTGAGYKVESREAKDGKFLRITSDETRYDINPYGCDDKGANCKSVQFYAGFTTDKKLSLTQINTYAREHRWGIVYLDSDNDPVIEFDLDLEKGGMSSELFLDNVAYWEAVMFGFADFVFKDNDETAKKN